MKIISLLALACATLTNAQLIKISGKWFEKTTVTSDDGTSTRTIFSAVDHPQAPTQTKSTLQLPPLGPAISVLAPHVISAAQKLNQKSRVKSLLSRLTQDNKKNHNNNDEADDKKQIQDQPNQIQESLTVAPTLYPSLAQNSIIPKPDVKILPSAPSIAILPNEVVATVSKVSTDRLDEMPRLPQIPTISTILPSMIPSTLQPLPSLRRISSPFRQVDSPFSRQGPTTIDENNNLSTHDTNRIDGKNNVIDGRFNDVIGNVNVINRGNYNQIRGDRNVIHYGDNNVIKGDGSFVAGSGNIIY